MPSLHQVKLPIPADWQELQRMTCDLFRCVWNDPYIQEFGSLGQRQNGVDIIGIIDESKKIEGIQCKCVHDLKPKDIEKEYKLSLAFTPDLSRFIMVTTTNRNSINQKKAIEISQKNLYPCNVIF